MDRGLNEQSEEYLNSWPQIMLMVLAVSAFLSLISGRWWGGLPFLLGFGALHVVFIGWPLLRHRSRRRLRLVLEPDSLRLTWQSPQGVETLEVRRDEAGSLARIATAAQPSNAEDLEIRLGDGRTAARLKDRLVHAMRVPFGVDLHTLGVDPNKIPLSVLFGTWWPDAGLRQTERKPSRLSRSKSRIGPWAQPDLDGYAAWKARRELGQGLLLLGVGAAFLAISTWLGFTAWAAEEGSGQLLEWIGVLILAIGVLVNALRYTFQAMRTLRHYGEPGLLAMARGILKRNG